MSSSSECLLSQLMLPGCFRKTQLTHKQMLAAGRPLDFGHIRKQRALALTNLNSLLPTHYLDPLEVPEGYSPQRTTKRRLSRQFQFPNQLSHQFQSPVHQ